MQEESEEPADTSLSFTGGTGGEDYERCRSRKVDTPSGRGSFARAFQVAALKVAAVIYEDALVIC